ncbi:transposon mariner sub-class [Hordeum vulgare]|nr:transposon mariner sub-class [Hordeum vulgare]KAE8800927.1 transposon mariner sub-class [Hordeum vulgare]
MATFDLNLAIDWEEVEDQYDGHAEDMNYVYVFEESDGENEAVEQNQPASGSNGNDDTSQPADVEVQGGCSGAGMSGNHGHNHGRSRLGLTGRRLGNVDRGRGSVQVAGGRLGLAGCRRAHAGTIQWQPEYPIVTGRGHGRGAAGRGRGRGRQLPDLNVATREDVEDEYTARSGNGNGGHDDAAGGEEHDEENGEAHASDPMHGNNPQPQQPREWSDKAKLTVYGMLLERTSLGIMKRGVTKEVSRLTGMPQRTVQDLWNKGKLYGGMLGVLNKKPKNCGRKRIDIDSESIKAVDKRKRTTIKDLANELNVSKTTVWRRLKEKQIRRHSNAIKGTLTDLNKRH